MTIDLEQTNGLRSMAIEPGGGRIAVTGVGELRVLDARGNLVARAETGHDDGHAALAFTKSGAVVGGKGNVVDVLEEGVHSRIEGKFDASRSPIRCLAEVAPGVVVTGHADGAIRRVDLAGRKFERVGYKVEARTIAAIACGAVPGTFVTAGERVLAEWDESERKPRAQHTLPGWTLAIDVTHRRALCGGPGTGGLVHCGWDGSDRVAVPGKSHEPKAAFLTSGALAVTLGGGELVVVGRGGELLARHEDPKRPSALCADGDTLWIVRGTSLASIAVGVRKRFSPREIRPRHAAPVARLLLLPSGFASHASDQAVKLWGRDGRFTGGIRLESGIDAAAVSANALLLGTGRGDLVTIDPESGTERSRVTLGRFRVWGIAGPNDEHWIAGVDLGREHALFHRGKKRATWRRRGPAQNMAWSESRRLLLVPSGIDGVVVLGEDGEPRATIRPTNTYSVLVSPDGIRFACAHGTGASVYSLDDLEAPPRTMSWVPETSGFAPPQAWRGNDALWLSRGAEAACVSIETGEVLGTVACDDRITSLLDLGDAVAVGTERGDVLVRTPSPPSG